MRETIKVVTAGEDTGDCRLLHLVLRQENDVSVVGHGTNGRELVDLLHKLEPHVALIDLDTPGHDMLAAANLINLEGKMSIIGLVGGANVDEALLGQVDIVLHKKTSLDKVVAAIRDVGRRISGELAVIQMPAAVETPDTVEQAGTALAGEEARPKAIASEMEGIPVSPLKRSETGLDTPSVYKEAHLDDGSDMSTPVIPSSIALTVSTFSSFRSAGAFQKALESLDGVRNAKIRHFHHGTLYQIVQYEGDIPFEERLKELVPFKPKVVAASRGSLDIQVEPEVRVEPGGLGQTGT